MYQGYKHHGDLAYLVNKLNILVGQDLVYKSLEGIEPTVGEDALDDID